MNAEKNEVRKEKETNKQTNEEPEEEKWRYIIWSDFRL